jgi:hypothetical protein
VADTRSLGPALEIAPRYAPARAYRRPRGRGGVVCPSAKTTPRNTVSCLSAGEGVLVCPAGAQGPQHPHQAKCEYDRDNRIQEDHAAQRRADEREAALPDQAAESARCYAPSPAYIGSRGRACAVRQPAKTPHNVVNHRGARGRTARCLMCTHPCDCLTQ